MGIFFGRNANSRSYGYSAELAKKITKKGGRNSSGAAALLNLMTNGPKGQTRLRGEEAEQAARSLREVAPKLRGHDRRNALAIAQDAQEASDSGKGWTLF